MQPESRTRRSHLPGPGIAAVLAAVATLSVTGCGDNSTAASSSDPSPSGSTAVAGSLHFPAEFGGYKRLPDTAETQQSAADVWPLPSPFQAAAYGRPGEDPQRSIIVGKVHYTPAAATARVKSTVQELQSEAAGWTFHAQPTGRYGGQLRCGSTSAGTAGSLCVFADATTFGISFAQGPPAASLTLARQLRTAVESPPA